MAEQLVRVGGRRLRVTNLDKVLYPETGTTKGELIEYVTQISPLMLPHLRGRPVTRKRWPDGVGTSAHPEPEFFAKDLEPGAPEWIPRARIEHSAGAKAYPLVQDLPTLVYLTQVASLELHVPQWRFLDSSRGNPDRLVLDLDPGPGAGLAECAHVARWARDILGDMGLDPIPLTSGSKGIHLYAALPGNRSSEQITAVAKALAQAIEADHPESAVSSMSKALRDGRVFIDWSQNNGSKTTIAPYSLRGRMHPTVAAPRTWEELEDPEIGQLLFSDMADRAHTHGDLLAPLARFAPGPLSVYLSKRDAARTPEPMPTQAHPSGMHGAAHPRHTEDSPRFVIQEHHASRLHWDLRLEHDGVLVSWAVPRGIPHSTAHNSLAVMTENHPIEYLDFEGTIPRGEYGAGTMTVWDTGTYELEKWRDDEVIFTATGRSGGPVGTVRLALIRTDGAGEKSTWLLHRMKMDARGFAQQDTVPVTARPPVEEAAQAKVAQATPIPTPTNPPPERDAPGSLSPPAHPTPEHSVAAMLATSSTAGLARARAEQWGASPWVEMKWDGVRALGIWDGQRLKLRARSGADITAKYPELSTVDTGFGETPAIVDGEIVAVDNRGRPSFARLQSRMNLRHPREIEREMQRTPVRYHVFDLLELNGHDLGSLPLSQRHQSLQSLAAHAISRVIFPPIFDDVDAALAASKEFGLEGIMVKNPAAGYRRGQRSEDWLKVKLTQTQEVVIGAIRPGRGSRAHLIGSLLLGIPSPQGLRYVGRVGSGFSDRALAHLSALLEPLRTTESPFMQVPAADSSDALWVQPSLVGEVEFAEVSPSGHLRHARWRGLRPDKAADQVVSETSLFDDEPPIPSR